MSELILIDFSWLYNKYYFVAQYSTIQENEGVKVQEDLELKLYSMLSQFLKRIVDCYPESKIFAVLDSPTSTLKNKEIFEGYKQNRDKEVKKEVYSCLNRMVVALQKFLNSESFSFVKAKEYEADQIIASLVKKFHNDSDITIYSGDKDLIQLTSYPRVSISDKFEKGKFLIKDDEELFLKFKNSKGESFTRISSNKRDILKYRVLKGDVSDNLGPVFPRIKDKEIAEIIQSYWMTGQELTEEYINEMLLNLQKENPKLADKLRDSKDTWLRNYKIMDLFHVDDMKIMKLGQ